MNNKIKSELSQEFKNWLAEKGLLENCASALILCKIFDLFDLSNYMFPPMLFGNSNELSNSDLINELDVDTYLNLQMEFLKYHADFWNEPLPNCDHVTSLTRITNEVPTGLERIPYASNYGFYEEQSRELYTQRNEDSDYDDSENDEMSTEDKEKELDDNSNQKQSIEKNLSHTQIEQNIVYGSNSFITNFADLSQKTEDRNLLNTTIIPSSMHTSTGRLRKDRPKKEFTEEKRKKMDHANELLKKRRKIKQIASLKVPDNDIRRTFMQDFFRYLNGHNFKGLKEFLEMHGDKHLVFRSDLVNNDTILGPQKTSIYGIDNYINYLSAITLTIPDGIFIPTNVFIRNSITNRVRCCCIHATVLFECTVVYDLLLQSKIPDSSDYCDVPSLIQSIKLKNTQDSINLTEIRHSLDKIEVSESVNKNYEFAKGNILGTKVKVTGSGMFVFFLNDKNKMYFHDFRLIEKKIQYL